MAINFLNNIASIGALTITRATTDPLLYLYNTTNGSGSTIRFSDQTTPSQVGDITYFHSDGSSQGGGASFHFRSEPDTVLVVGSSTVNGRFVSKSAGSAGEVDYGFYDDVNTGMYRAGADIVRLVAGGVQGLSVSTSIVSLAYNGSTKIATVNTGVDVTGTAQMDTGITEGIHYVGTGIEHWGDGGTGMSFPANDIISLRTASSDRLYIDSLGNVGIGTTSPSGKLNVAYTGTGGTGTLGIGEGFNIYSLSPNITFNDNSTGIDDYAIHLNQNVFTLGRYTSSTAMSPDLVLKSGKVGIGTVSPSVKLEVLGQDIEFYSGTGDQSLQLGRNVNERLELYVNDNMGKITAIQDSDGNGPHNFILDRTFLGTGSNDFQIQKNGSTQLIVDTNGNVGIGTTSPATELQIGDYTDLAETITIATLSDGTGRINFYDNNTTEGGSIRMSGKTNGATMVLAGRWNTDTDRFTFDLSNGAVKFNNYDSTNNTGTPTYILGTDASGNVVKVLGSNIPTAAPATPGSLVATIVGETIEIAFAQSSTSDIGYYQVWSSDDGGDYGIIAQITPTDFSATMTVVDTTFVTGGTMSYRVYAVKNGVFSSPGTVSKAYTVGALTVTNMTVVNLNTAYYVQYEKPTTRFIDHIEIWMDSTATSGALLRANAVLVYSGQNASYMRNVNTSSNFHQFWVEIVTS